MSFRLLHVPSFLCFLMGFIHVRERNREIEEEQGRFGRWKTFLKLEDAIAPSGSSVLEQEQTKCRSGKT